MCFFLYIYYCICDIWKNSEFAIDSHLPGFQDQLIAATLLNEMMSDIKTDSQIRKMFFGFVIDFVSFKDGHADIAAKAQVRFLFPLPALHYISHNKPIKLYYVVRAKRSPAERYLQNQGQR